MKILKYTFHFILFAISSNSSFGSSDPSIYKDLNENGAGAILQVVAAYNSHHSTGNGYGKEITIFTSTPKYRSCQSLTQEGGYAELILRRGNTVIKTISTDTCKIGGNGANTSVLKLDDSLIPDNNYNVCFSYYHRPNSPYSEYRGSYSICTSHFTIAGIPEVINPQNNDTSTTPQLSWVPSQGSDNSFIIVWEEEAFTLLSTGDNNVDCETKKSASAIYHNEVGYGVSKLDIPQGVLNNDTNYIWGVGSEQFGKCFFPNKFKLGYFTTESTSISTAPSSSNGTTSSDGGFNFCSSNSSNGGNGKFEQQLLNDEVVEIGELPAGIEGIQINLTSQNDVDIQLFDKETGKAIVHWPEGILYADGKQSTEYGGVTVEWSGYNGDEVSPGNEYIKIIGKTDRAFIMKAFGFQPGYSTVSYSWTGGVATECEIPKTGGGTFQQQIVQDKIVEIGEIPAGIKDLIIILTSDKDLDIQLYDKETGAALIAWPNGILNGDSLQFFIYEGMGIEWSGYNGDEISQGNEYIIIKGTSTKPLVMKAFGFSAGQAKVEYSWGTK